MKRFVVVILLCLLAVTAAAQEQSPTPGSIEGILTIEDPTERIAALRKFLKTNNLPDQARTAKEALVASWAQIADSFLNASEVEKAMEAFDESIAALPDEITDTFFNDTVIRIPLALSLRGYRAQAVMLARKLEPRCAGEGRRLAAIGEFYMTIEAPNDAIRALEEAFSAGEDTALLHRALGAAYRIGLRLDDAIAQYQQAIRLAPDDKRAYYELGNLYRAFGAYPDAINLYRKQLELDPRHTSSHKGIALAHLAMGDESKATEALNKAREIRGADEELTMDLYLQTQLAFTYLQRNNFPKARRAAEAALAIEPRYAWARLAAAEVDLAEGKYFEAEKNLLAARPYASFPTLSFTFGKLYLAVEDFDGALEQFAQAFEYSPADGFTSTLGGSLSLKSENLSDLLAAEHRAAIYLAEPPTSPETFRIAQSLVRFNVRLGLLRDQVQAARRPVTRKQLEDLDKDAMDFIEVENLRRSFRSLYISQRLAMAGVSTGTAAELADIALGLADIAVGPEGSLRDYPNFDFQGRLSIFRGRTLDAKGWALFKSGKVEEAVETLSQSVAAFGLEAEGKRAIWHLATARETAGAVREALDLYIAGYQPPEDGKSTDINRTVIEVLYKKVNGSLNGLDSRIEKRQELSNRVVGELIEKYRPRTEKVAEAREPEPAPPAEKSGGLRLSLGPDRADRSTQLRELSRIEQAERTSRPSLSPTDPMFARREAVRTERPKPAEPEIIPAVSTTAVRLPGVEAGPVQLPTIESTGLRFPSSSLEELALRGDDLTPPNPPEMRRLPVRLPDYEDGPVIAIIAFDPLELLIPSPDLEELALRSKDMTPPDPPQTHTRKRRVTSRDLQTQSTTTRKRRIKP